MKLKKIKYSNTDDIRLMLSNDFNSLYAANSKGDRIFVEENDFIAKFLQKYQKF